MSQKPMVDRLKQELAGRAQVIRIDVRSASGQELAESLGLEMVPTFIIFDKSGTEIWRKVGLTNRQKLLSRIDPLI